MEARLTAIAIRLKNRIDHGEEFGGACDYLRQVYGVGYEELADEYDAMYCKE